MKDKMLNKHSIKNTRPRQKVLEYIKSLGKKHFTVADILSRAGGNVSRASIYRVIKLFTKAGILREIDIGKDYFVYEIAGQTGHHDHMYCVKCGKIVEFENQTIENIQKDVCKKTGFLPLTHTLRIIGTCRQCRSSRK